ncbi:M90 family metallopeptidase [Dyadobacter psychrotolerans]|uniref:Peptidase n=1 Tax=Dyadobacter psychrotolerans TaxID=2541721 RepID=A0A4R5DHP1_9BACT|nr:M90 family metallopeptidase [Dyadobacter psychrotolerans]TDE10275.1 peptidase [Dyadobacter psychrotolerans]
MTKVINSADDLLAFYQASLKSVRLRAIGIQLTVMVFFGALAFFSHQSVLYFVGLITVGIIEAVNRNYFRKTYRRVAIFNVSFPTAWQEILDEHVLFYKTLDKRRKSLFERRVQLFLAEKKVEGIDTEINDQIRLLVASSAIIPTFAFPAFDYPELNEVLIYPKSFSKQFEIEGADQSSENIEGMVGNRYMNHSLLLSKPSLLAGFNGRKGEENVGIHEFVHLLDREDGEADGIPERLAESGFTLPWLHLIKKEMNNIRSGHSDINPYAITNNAEFLAVVSEYFFSDPQEFHEKHPELYNFLSGFYHQQLAG